MPIKLRDFGIDTKTFNFFNDALIPNVKELLDATGCGFCLAKFRQVTLHLGTGMVHSCHHPTPHKIPLDELRLNPMALINTGRLKQARKQMLNGEKPAECDYCWRVEANGSNSDRYLKSRESWALADHDTITDLSGDEDILPTYLEVSFSNVCNQGCLYCGPEYSSKWVEELKQHGPVVLFPEKEDGKIWAQGWQDLDNLSYKNRDVNPYIDAFWEIWPNLYRNLKHYRITGGEPLMSKETYRSMDWLIENPNTDLELSINSNLSVPDKLWVEFISRLDRLRLDRVKKVTIYTSVEGWGERASYSRYGLDFDLLKQRVEQLAAMGNIRVVIMATFNIFSITSFRQLLEWVREIKMQYNPNNQLCNVEDSTGFFLDARHFAERRDRNPAHSVIVGLDIPYLRQPEYLDAQWCTHQLAEDHLLPALKYMSQNVTNDSWVDNHQGFDQHEFEKFKRIVLHRLYFNNKSSPDRERDPSFIKNRAAFYDFVTEMDRRRGTNFLQTYPEMADYFEVCRQAKAEYIA